MEKTILCLAFVVLLTACNYQIQPVENETVTELVTIENPDNEEVETDNRILLTPENANNYSNFNSSDYVREDFNFDPPTTTVTYENREKGIRVELPYNPDWGSENYRLNPYDECIDSCTIYRNTVLFGPIGESEGGWTRHRYTLRFEEADYVDMIIKNAPDQWLVMEPERKTINGMDVVKIADRGLMETFSIMIPTKNYTYNLMMTGKVEDMDEIFAELEEIVETVEFIS